MSEFIGKTVRLRNGVVTGPIKTRDQYTCNTYPLTDGVYTWTAEGKNIIGGPDNEYDIVEILDEIGLTNGSTIFLTRGEEKINSVAPVELTATPSLGRIYLAGPMAGYPERNYPAFMRAAKALRDLGFEVYNPAEYEANERFKGKEDRSEFPLREAFTEYTNYILNRAEIIALLPGHEKSVGATAELSLARVVKLKEIYL